MPKRDLPRNFRLIEELERSEKGQLSDSISYGLDESDPEDRTLSLWNATLIGQMRTPFMGRIYDLSIFCGKDYPVEPPQVRFLTCIEMPCVQPNGVVDPTKVALLRNWDPSRTMEDVLKAIVGEMARAPNVPQPVEGVRYS